MCVCDSLATASNRHVMKSVADRHSDINRQSDTTSRMDLLVTCVSFYVDVWVCFDKVYY